MRHWKFLTALSLLLALGGWIWSPSLTLAVSTSHWTQNKESDFKGGTFHNVVATNLGDIKLSREVKTLLDENPDVGSVTCLAQASDGTIYAGTSPKGILLKVVDDKVTTVAKIEGAVSINALLIDKEGGVLIATSGEAGHVLRIDKPGDQPREIFAADGVQYVWALSLGSDGTVYSATGPNGQLFAIPKEGKASEIYKSDESNLTAMASDGHEQLYLGSDPDGLVIRFNIRTKETFVVYNAGEEDVTALALDADGSLYVATGQPAGEQEAQTSAEPEKEKAGRPEATPGVSTPLPSQPPSTPKPPAPPNPNPGQPAPIPKKTLFNTRRAISPVYLATSGKGATRNAVSPDGGDGEPAPDGAPVDPNADGNKPGNAKPGAADGEENKPQGNAVYRIDPDGFVQEIFRQDVVIYAMLESQGVLLIGTGNEGRVWQIDPRAEETVVLAKTDSKEVTALLQGNDGRVILGLSNTGSLAAMNKGYADTGIYVSPVLDAHQVSRFGRMQLHGFLPDKTSLKVATRSGNLKDADAKGWSDWSSETPASQFVKIATPSARFLQYRITFETQDASATPVIKDVDVMYQSPNQAPVVKGIKIETQLPENGGGGHGMPGHDGPKPGEEPKPVGTGLQNITWDASDPNNDALTYTLYFRAASSNAWILLKDKITDSNYTWDTKTVADGRYEVKVVASDAAANPEGQGKTASRVSEALAVDNTPPAIGDIVSTVSANGDVKISLRVTDQTSIVASTEYSVDSNDVWQSVLPTDNIFDSPDETVVMTIHSLGAGQHQIALRAADDKGNMGVQAITVTVPARQ